MVNVKSVKSSVRSRAQRVEIGGWGTILQLDRTLKNRFLLFPSPPWRLFLFYKVPIFAFALLTICTAQPVPNTSPATMSTSDRIQRYPPNPGVEYALFFPNGGNVLLNVEAAKRKKLHVRWLDIRQGTWQDEEVAAPTHYLRLVTPKKKGYWAAVVKAESNK